METNNNTSNNNFQSRKISAETIAKILRITPDNLATHGIIQPSRSSGFNCPTCGNGTGSQGTGMNINPRVQDQTSFHCFACGENFNVLQLCALHY
ncbi:MAG: hypothetical protein IKZ53_03380 [Selenomonadaceae bacterium]|nr:hypothetical protein [Selenomonadaceae bacterium]